VITREQAERIAADILGAAPGDADRGWELQEFESGWLIREAAAGDASYRGAATRVVERSSGRVMRFPSSVPPGRILEDYDRVAPRGRIEKEAEEPR
jgi:hypothetical protein